ncbi:MAG: type I restriction enzyme HsdR N-terminal domain-containing protein [Flavobacteriales bacterium]
MSRHSAPDQDPRAGWPDLSLPPCPLDVEWRDGQWALRCTVRQRWVKLEPEEWVRQHVVASLMTAGWPTSRMVLEHPVRVGQVDGRIDIACFDREGRVALAVEVKAPQVKLDQSVADQVARYDLALGCPWLMISNGLQNAVWKRGEDGACRPHRGWPVPEGDSGAHPVE